MKIALLYFTEQRSKLRTEPQRNPQSSSQIQEVSALYLIRPKGHSAGDFGNERNLGTWKKKFIRFVERLTFFSVRTDTYINDKKMGHLISPFWILLYKTFQKWDVPRWRKAGWMIVVTCHTHFFFATWVLFQLNKIFKWKKLCLTHWSIQL